MYAFSKGNALFLTLNIALKTDYPNDQSTPIINISTYSNKHMPNEIDKSFFEDTIKLRKFSMAMQLKNNGKDSNLYIKPIYQRA